MNKLLSILYRVYTTIESFIYWLDVVSDRGMIWVADRLMGEHEDIEIGRKP